LLETYIGNKFNVPLSIPSTVDDANHLNVLSLSIQRFILTHVAVNTQLYHFNATSVAS